MPALARLEAILWPPWTSTEPENAANSLDLQDDALYKP
jgi:hypothetical protein